MLVCIVSVLLLATGSVVHSLKLPAFFPLCKSSDPKVHECLSAAVEKSIRELKNGNKELRLLPLDPAEITKIILHQGNGPVNLNLELIDVTVTGFSNTKVNNITIDRSNGKYDLHAEALIPYLTLHADYVMDGKFLILPIKGKGRCDMTGDNLDAQIIIKGEDWEKDGKIYMKISKLNMLIGKIDRMTVQFENLFNGDKTLGDSTNSLLNDNWPEFWEELKPSFEETASRLMEVYVTKIFHNVPINDILLD